MEKHNNRPFVSVIVVNYNGTNYLNRCFSSLFSLNYPQDCLEIIMVDNGSSDGSCEIVKKQFPRVKIVINDVNSYAKASNLGVKAAQGSYIAFLNNDTWVDSSWLGNVIDKMMTDDRIGAVTGKILFPDGTLQSTGHSELPNFYWCDRGFKEPERGQFSFNEHVKSISHCAAVYRKSCIEDNGMLDEDFNFYLEDVDYSLRAQKRGWVFSYVPTAIVYHVFHGTASEKDVSFYCERNRLLLLAKHFPQELPKALTGKGYFGIVQNNKSDLIAVLPVVIMKIIKSHERCVVESVLPVLFDELRKFLYAQTHDLAAALEENKKENVKIKTMFEQAQDRQQQNSAALDCASGQIIALEKDRADKTSLIQQLTGQLSAREQDIRVQISDIKRIKEEFALKESLICGLTDQVRDKEQVNQDLLKRIDKAFVKLKEQDDVLKSKDDILKSRDDVLESKDDILKSKDEEIYSLNRQISSFYQSESYRFVVRPLWFLLNVVKSIFSFRKKPARPDRIAVIKPDCVSQDDAIGFLKDLHIACPASEVTIVSFDEKNIRLLDNPNIAFCKKNLFDRPQKCLNIWQGLVLIYRLNILKLSQCIVLIQAPVYLGYRQAKCIAIASGARTVSWHYLSCFRKREVMPVDSILMIIQSWIHVAVLFFIMIIFMLFIVFPIRFRKLFHL
jgi:GT2 family glycosyltransferase